jgi:peptide-methionine (S)-S-oxide reductase
LPEALDRQGPDVGTQYRSVIFCHTPKQMAAAVASRERLDRSGALKRPIVTEIVAASAFYRAEEYHQRYLEKRGDARSRAR